MINELADRSTAQWLCVVASQYEWGFWGLKCSFVSYIRSYTFILSHFALSSGFLVVTDQ